MKITGSAVSTASIGAARLDAATPADGAASTASGSGASSAPLQSEVLKPAADALRAMPDFDAARVAELRAALARGELPFDAGRLAGLIQKFHGGR